MTHERISELIELLNTDGINSKQIVIEILLSELKEQTS